MKFFVPAATDDEMAEQVWSATKALAEETTARSVSDRRIFRIAYTHGGKDYAAEVGETEPRTGEIVLVILEADPFLVCTGTRGVVRGQPIMVGKEEIYSVEAFDSPGPAGQP